MPLKCENLNYPHQPTLTILGNSISSEIYSLQSILDQSTSMLANMEVFIFIHNPRSIISKLGEQTLITQHSPSTWFLVTSGECACV